MAAKHVVSVGEASSGIPYLSKNLGSGVLEKESMGIGGQKMHCPGVSVPVSPSQSSR